MTAPEYSERRKGMAHAIGLGRKRGGSETARAPASEAGPKKRGRPRKVKSQQG
jgi:hypothetical protein